MAVIGRTSSENRLPSQTATLASKSALFSGREQLDVLIERMSIAARDSLGEEIPMARREFRGRTIGPVFRDHLLTIRQPRADPQNRVRLPQVGLVGIQRGRIGPQRIPGRKRKGHDQPPVGREEAGRATVGEGDRLPPIRIDDLRRCIDGHIRRVVGIRGTTVDVTELVGIPWRA